MKTVLPGATIGLLGGGESARLIALAARRMGYRVHLYSPDTADPARSACDEGVQRGFEDLISVRQFAASVDLVTVPAAGVPAATVASAADAALLRPSAATLDGAAGYSRPAGEIRFEFCMLGARGPQGEYAFYPPIAVDRAGGAIDIARAPAAIGAPMAREACHAAREIFGKLDLAGVACVSFFVTPEQDLVAGECSPYPHPCGHLTLDAAITSQYAQHVRAVCGLPLGNTALLRPAAAADLPGSIWEGGEPDWASALALSEVRLHLYGARSGHLTATAASATLAKQIVRAARLALRRA